MVETTPPQSQTLPSLRASWTVENKIEWFLSEGPPRPKAGNVTQRHQNLLLFCDLRESSHLLNHVNLLAVLYSLHWFALLLLCLEWMSWPAFLVNFGLLAGGQVTLMSRIRRRIRTAKTRPAI
ncbi:hypothetical protein [Vibrio coralliilyticus]|uniref:hypothetical protein n=1 Tax=Vibrio coralliilyticus TaxID=190893 RepID=UPI00155F7334|nr:hypothetical protein [Vibrio coralliilyticus]NRF32217.1 hypothetical protein [Vibrio coralliilyticus]NRF53288.1 hypothetical protein [Vibrio coralliilyticus]NRG03472.1 hypothetical protein [Vibrio coralliilyticus]